MGFRVLVQIVVLTLILEAVRVGGQILLPLQWINTVFIVHFWLLFHPQHPAPWAWRFGWLVAAHAAAPLLPFGSLLVAGIIFVVLIRFIQDRYIEHTHWAAFLLLVTIGLIVWDLILAACLALATMVTGSTTILIPNTALASLLLIETITTMACVALLLMIDSFADHGSIRSTLRRYYEHLHEPQDRTHR